MEKLREAREALKSEIICRKEHPPAPGGCGPAQGGEESRLTHLAGKGERG